jgi:hypothetical protein
LESYDALVLKKAPFLAFTRTQRRQLPEELLVQYSFQSYDGSWLLDQFFLDRGRTSLLQVVEISKALARDLIIGRNIMNRNRGDFFCTFFSDGFQNLNSPEC